MRAFEAMKLPGASLEELIELNEAAVTASTAIRKFWSHYSDKEEIYQLGLRAMKGPLPQGLPLKTVPGAIELLNELQVSHDLALVTLGEEKTQLEKLEKAGIQQDRFSKLIVSTGPDKKNDYCQVLHELQVDPRDVIVCGDKVSKDLVPAKELGLYTVHFRNGRGMVDTTPKECVDMTIDRLNQFTEVFSQYEG